MRSIVCLILLVLTMPLAAAGEPPGRAVAIAVLPGEDASAAIGPQAAELIQKSIRRYRDTFIIGYAEYNTVTCRSLGKGSWTDPTPGLRPRDSGRITRRDFSGRIVGGGHCDGEPIVYAAIYFEWTLHRNKTAREGEGPLALFSSTWTSDDHFFSFDIDFEITVPVVRPRGEISTFSGFVADGRGAYGRWVVTLWPPGDDPGFDFEGEKIREKFIRATDTCAGRAPGALGPPVKSDPSTKPAEEAAWIVGQLDGAPAGKNQYGPDYVGWSACAIHAYRCTKVTTPPCGIELVQGVTIKSPADRTFTAPLYTNTLSESIGGSIFGGTRHVGFGSVWSRRGDAGIHSTAYTSSDLSCSALVLGILRRRPNSCFAE